MYSSLILWVCVGGGERGRAEANHCDFFLFLFFILDGPDQSFFDYYYLVLVLVSYPGRVLVLQYY
jgi:hypothetical protein